MGKILATVAFILILFGGCSSPADQETIKTQQATIVDDATKIDGLNKQISSLQKDIDDQVAQHKVDIENESDEVTRAQACDYILPFCPASLIEQGRKFTGKIDGNGWFWWYVCLKFIFIAVFIAGFIPLLFLLILVLDWLYLHITAPKRSQIKVARGIIKSAQKLLDNQATAIAAFEREKNKAQKIIVRFYNRIYRLDTYLKKMTGQLERVNEEIKSKKEFEDAIQTFKTLK